MSSNYKLNPTFNIKPLGPIDGPIEAFEQSYWFLFIVEELGQQLGPNDVNYLTKESTTQGAET